jgi:ABC-2 type transport system permease protein
MLSQFMSRGSALGVAGGYLAASYLLNNLTVNARDLEFIRYVLPLYYESQSKPLARSVGVNWGSLSVLVILVIPLLGLALAMYLRRDHNGYFNFGRTSNRPATVKTGTSFSVWRNSPFLFSLRSGLISAAIWGAGLSLYTFMMVSAIPGIRNDIMRLLNSDLYRNINIPAGSSDNALVNMLLFTTGLMVFVAFAIMRVASWSSEENNGRLEMLLSTPQPRWKMLLSYFAAALIALAALVAIVWLALLASAAVVGLTLDMGKVAAGFIGLWILCAVVTGAGYILAAFGPGWAVAAVSGLVVVSYASDLFGNFLKLPEAITNLSIFKHYNYPLINGLNWTTQAVFGAIVVGFIAVALWNFRRRDIQK